MQQPPNDRTRLVQLIADNREQFTKPEYIEALFASTVADLEEGGVDAISVRASMIRSFVLIEQERVGAAAVIEMLRTIADRLEQPLLKSAAGVRH